MQPSIGGNLPQEMQLGEQCDVELPESVEVDTGILFSTRGSEAPARPSTLQRRVPPRLRHCIRFSAGLELAHAAVILYPELSAHAAVKVFLELSVYAAVELTSWICGCDAAYQTAIAES